MSVNAEEVLTQTAQGPKSTRARPIRALQGGFVGNLGTGETTIYTCPGLSRVRIDCVYVYNPSGGALIFTGHIVPLGGAAATTNEFRQESVASHTPLAITNLNAILSAGDVVSGKGDSAGLNVWVSGEVVE